MSEQIYNAGFMFGMINNFSLAQLASFDKNFGFSVRCVKD